jgi:Kdo2-lipid IVA lauroyltransferase/acyltransferase
MSSSSKKFKHDLIFAGVKALIAFIQWLPREHALKFAGVLGEIAAILDAKERHLAEMNLRMAYGDKMSDAKIGMIARECFVMMARNAADVIRSQKWDSSDLRDLVDIDGIEHFDEAMRRGKGVVGITGHIGNFELCAAWFGAVHRTPISVIGRKLYDNRLDRMVVENREKFGEENVPSDASAKKVYSVLKSGRMLGVLMDLDSHRIAGYFVPFFGRLAKTAAGPMVLGRKTESPVVPMALFRTPNDRYLLKILPAFDIPLTDNKEEDVKQALAMCNKALEELINFDPTQWAWIHNRWRSKPSPESNVQGGMEEVSLSSE